MPKGQFGPGDVVSADGGSIPYRIPPPPPPVAVQRVLSIVFAVIAAIAGFSGFSLVAGISAVLSLVFNLSDLFTNRGVVQIPRSALDAEGKLQVEERR